MFRENETKSNKKDKIQKYFNQKGFLPVKSNFKCPYLHSEDINIQKKCTPKMDAPKWLNGTSNQSGATGGIDWGPYQGSLVHLGASGGLRNQIYAISGPFLTFPVPCQSLKFLWSHEIACTRAPHNGSGSWEPD